MCVILAEFESKINNCKIVELFAVNLTTHIFLLLNVLLIMLLEVSHQVFYIEMGLF